MPAVRLTPETGFPLQLLALCTSAGFALDGVQYLQFFASMYQRLRKDGHTHSSLVAFIDALDLTVTQDVEEAS